MPLELSSGEAHVCQLKLFARLQHRRNAGAASRPVATQRVSVQVQPAAAVCVNARCAKFTINAYCLIVLTE